MICLAFSCIDDGPDEASREDECFETIEEARARIIEWLGPPEVGSDYAISGDGCVKVEVIDGPHTLHQILEPYV